MTFILIILFAILFGVAAFIVICSWRYYKRRSRKPKTEILHRIVDIDLKRKEHKYKFAISIGIEVPKFIPLKSARVTKEDADNIK